MDELEKELEIVNAELEKILSISDKNKLIMSIKRYNELFSKKIKILNQMQNLLKATK